MNYKYVAIYSIYPYNKPKKEVGIRALIASGVLRLPGTLEFRVVIQILVFTIFRSYLMDVVGYIFYSCAGGVFSQILV